MGSICGRQLPGFAAFLLLGSMMLAPAADPDKSTPAAGKVEPAAKGTISFEMRGKPWKDVIEWYADLTGLAFAGDTVPTGTFTFIPPKTGQRQFTLPQVTDIINEGLSRQKLLLLRRNTQFTVIAADEKISPQDVPRLDRISDLEDRGNTELVSVQLQLKSLVAVDVAPEVKKMLGPFGDVVALDRANQLVLQDMAGNLKRVIGTIKNIEENDAGLMETFSHTCKYIKARDGERILRDLLGDPAVLLKAQEKSDRGNSGSGFPFGGSGGLMGLFGGGSPFGPGGFGKGSSDRGSSDRGSSDRGGTVVLGSKGRIHFISCDERTNTVLVTGPADKVSQAREIMKRIDVPQPKDQPPLLIGNPVLKTYNVRAGTADAVAKTLQDVYKNTPEVRITAIGGNSIMVWARPEDQFAIAQYAQGSSDRPSATEVIGMNNLDAASAADTLKGIFGDAKTGAPFIQADTSRNAVIVSGTPEQVQQVREVLRVIDPGAGSGAASTMRVITLPQGSAATLADFIQRTLPKIRSNPVEVITPGGSEPSRPPAKEKEKLPPPDPKKGDVRTPSLATSPDPFLVMQADEKPQLADPQEKKKDLPGKADSPVRIMAFGNKLIITSDDPVALALVQELIRLATTPGGEGDFEVIRLRNANATEAAKILDEAFNGTRPQSNRQGGADQGGNPFARMFGGGFPGAQPTPAPTPSGTSNRIRVVADPATNSLLVQATPLDMLTVRRLIDHIDTDQTESRAVLKTKMIGPLKHANAVEVATVIRDVYRESMNNNSRIGVSSSSFGGFGFGSNRSPMLNIDPSGNPRGVSLSVGVDDRTNSIIVHTTEAIFEDVKKLVDELERAAQDSNRTVRVVSIKGIPPELVQQAISAIQGRSTMSSQAPGFGGSGRGGFSGFGSSGFGSSGFTPFGTGGFITPGGSSPFGGFSPGGFSPGGSSGPGGSGFSPRGTSGGSSRGGGPPGRGGSRRSDDRGGSDFFASTVKDDQELPTVLYDPQQEQDHHGDVSPEEPGPDPVAWPAEGLLDPGQPLQLVDFQQEQQPPAKPAQPPAQPGQPPAGQPDTVRGPRAGVNVEALEQLGVIVISGNNPADVEAIVQLIRMLENLGAAAIELVPLDFADATSVANTLRQVVIGAVVPAAAAPGAAAAPPAVQAGQQGSVILVPLPRHNAILVAAPRPRLDDVIREIKRLDRPGAPQGQTHAFPLRKASAARVALLLQQFYAQRFPNEQATQNQIRITQDDSTNTVFVQAAPADLAEIRNLIDRIDQTVSNVVHDLRIVPLRNALATDLANLLLQAIAQGFAAPTTLGAPGIVPTTPGAAAIPGLPGIGQQPGALPGIGQQPGLGQLGTGARALSLRFLRARPDDKLPVETGLLEGIGITADPRTNSLILAAPTRTMELLLALIRELDVPPAARAEIKIFTLKRADAAQTATLLQQLFAGTGALPGTTGAVPGTGALPGAGAIPGTQLGAGVARPLLTLAGVTPEGVPLIDLRITIDVRTNSVIVAGSTNDLDVIEAIISRLEDSEVEQRHNEVYRLRNANAADVAAALQTFLTRNLQIQAQGGQLTQFQELERDVVIVPEPITNTLLISATAKYYADLVRMIAELDAQPPQVVIQVLIAEVNLQDIDELGVEFGLQSPVLFSRSLLADGSLVNNAIGLPGFNFNTTAPLPNSSVVNPSMVGYQGLQNLGVGRSSPTLQNVGGFIFSAQSNGVNLLIRALRAQNRIDILSRPQIMTLDRQAASILVGQSFPYPLGTNVTATGIISTNVGYRNIGVQLDVTPLITPDNNVIMRVTPQISSPVPGTLDLGGGVFATIFNVQTVDTTVVAHDGETVAIGGLITKNDQLTENKIPWFGDLPYLGGLFRYRNQVTQRRELLVILTPHVVRCAADAERILAEESQRIDWVLSDLVETHGANNMGAILRPRPNGGGPVLPHLPAPPAAPDSQLLPQPRVLPGNLSPGQPMQPPAQGSGQPVNAPVPPQEQAAPATPAAGVVPSSYQIIVPHAPPPTNPQPPFPQEKASPVRGLLATILQSKPAPATGQKEASRWDLLQKK